MTALFKTLKASFQYTPRSLRLAYEASPLFTITICILTVCSAVLPLAIAYVGKLIIDAVMIPSVPLTMRWVILEFAVIALAALVQRSLFLLRTLLGERLGLNVNIHILEKSLTLQLSQFENSEFYDKLTRARREASSRPVQMVTDSFQLLQNALTLFGYVTLLISFNSWAVLGLVIASLPATIAEMRFSNLAFRLRNWRSADSRKLMYVEHVIATDSFVKEMMTLGLGETLLGRYKKLGESFYEEDKKLSVRRSIWAFLLSLLTTIAFYSCYLIMAIAAAKGALTLGNLTLYVVAFRQGQQAFQSCLTAIGSMYEHNLYMSNLFEFLSLKKKEPAKLALPTSKEAQPSTGIYFDHVGFRYPDKETWALKDITLHIPAGQSVALVGHNGAGKTTLIKLLARLYDPTEGRILLDGKDLRDWDREKLWKRFSIVFQDFNKYQFKFSENVGMGHVEHMSDETRILRAVDRGGAGEVLATLPEGLETQLGHWFIEGTELSGGQWQKIALSRGFMREEADILILDEPTAALDAAAEYAVFERFRNLAKGRTTFLISHRFPTVRLADRIIVINDSRIVEQGTHEELIKAGQRYAQLFALQAKGYA